MQNNETPNKNSQQKGKPALIFGAAALLFTGVMGYEAFRENSSKNALKESEKKLPIISNFAKDAYPRADKVELALLNAQNHHYSNKIIALKEEAHQNSKRLHALQIAILSTEREKENREIEKLRKNLEEDRNETKLLQTSFNELQKNINQKEIEIANLELTVDTLFDQIESEKKQTHHLKTQFEMQMLTLEQSTAEEKGILKNAIYDLETKQEKLKTKLKEHLAQIDQLESELTTVNLAALDKELEKDSLTEDLKLKKLKLTAQSKNLSYIIGTEQLIAKHLQKELYYAEAELAALSQAFLENKEKATEHTVHNLHALSIHDQLASSLTLNLHKKQRELKQLKNVHNSLLYDRNSLKKELEEKNLEIASSEQKALNLAKKNETLLEDIEKFKNWISEKESLAQIDQMNAKTMLTNLKELESLLEIRENELLLTQEAFENKRGTEKEFAEQLEIEKNQSLVLNQELNKLKDLLNQREEQLNENQNFIANKEQANVQLNLILTSQQNEIAELKNNYSHTTSLNEKIKEELDSYRAALDEALTLHEKERQETKKLEEKLTTLKELESLLEIRENELLLTQEAFENKRGSEKELAEQLEIEKNQSLVLNQELNKLKDLLNQREEQLNENQNFIANKEQANIQLNLILTSQQNEIAELKNNYSHTTSLNEEIKEELDSYRAALNEALTLHEKERQETKKLEEKLTNLKELESLLEIRENELLLTQEAFENKRGSEKELTEQLEIEKNQSLVLNQELNKLKDLLNQREEQLNENQNFIANKEQANVQLNLILTSQQNEIAELKNNYSHTTSLNEEIKEELDSYRAALDEALTLHEKERQTAKVLEEKLANLDNLLNQKEEELIFVNNSVENHAEINMQLAKEVDERQEAFKQALSHYEEAKNQAIEKEKELHYLTELLLHRENEIQEIRHLFAETEKNNEKLSFEIKKHQEDLNLSLEEKKQVELKREEAESSLANLVDLLKTRENELLEAKAITSKDKLENERLASEMEDASKELLETLAKYNMVQQKSDENNQQLNALIEKLMNREKDLLQMLEEETIKHAGFETNLERLDQTRKNLQTELNKVRANYASLLNGFNETKEMPILEMLKSHIVVPGDTLRGISLHYYGSPNRWKEIYHANQANIKNQDQIPVGTKLTIP